MEGVDTDREYGEGTYCERGICCTVNRNFLAEKIL